MADTYARFPRTAYARQIENLAAEMDKWVAEYEWRCSPEAAYQHSEAEMRLADNRRYFLRDISHRLYQLAADVALMS